MNVENPEGILPQWIDTHCHLDASEFDADRPQVVARAQASGVCQWVIPAVAAVGFERAERMALVPGAFLAWGLHPVYLTQHEVTDLQLLEQQIQRHRPVAVGEIGLDFFLKALDRDAQLALLRAQLKLANDYALPVILHCRKANDELVRELRRFGVRRGIVHAFNGSDQQARAFIEQGMCLGIGGNVTFERARTIRHLATTLPMESIVLETDAPDMPPAFAWHKRNEPAFLRLIAEVVAGLRSVSLETLSRVTSDNASRVLNLINPV